ncbi:hypothetical protein N665_0008s0018 [Sinapis alba]|nr:hypothetical protein N665_0008s0018 [Sinapis alba]
MENTESSISSSSSGTRIEGYEGGPPLCHCSRVTKVTKSWTDDNPGRRFFRCPIHGFYSWADVEKACVWQKLSLIEAREQIRRQQLEIRQLKDKISEQFRPSIQSREGSDSNPSRPISVEDKSLEISVLEVDILNASEREKMLKQVLILSWGGFIAVTAIIVATLKD